MLPPLRLAALHRYPVSSMAGVQRAAGRAHDACLGVIADVVEPGTVRTGDELR